MKVCEMYVVFDVVLMASRGEVRAEHYYCCGDVQDGEGGDQLCGFFFFLFIVV